MLNSKGIHPNEKVPFSFIFLNVSLVAEVFVHALQRELPPLGAHVTTIT